MFLFLFITHLYSKKQICICNGECSSLCSSNIIDLSLQDSQLKNFFYSQIENENEIELDLYSKQENYTFKIDSTLFGARSVTMKALSDSKIIILQIKTSFLPHYKAINLQPNFKIELPSLIPFHDTIRVANKKILKNYIAEQVSSAVPISVGFLQFERSGTQIKCSINNINNGDPISFNGTNYVDPKSLGCETEDLESGNATKCGLNCWSENNNLTLSYTFKGVQFAIYGTKNKWVGKIRIELDGVHLTDVNEYENLESSKKQFLLYRSDPIEYKEHKIQLLSLPNNNNVHYEIYKLVCWQKESDGIGGAREYRNPGKATIDLYCSKFWIYGVRDAHLGTVDVKYNGIQDQYSQYSSHQENGVLMYESPELSNFNFTLEISTKFNVLMLYCIYYEEPPIPLSIGLTQMNFEGQNECHLRNNSKVSFDSDIQHFGCEYQNLASPAAYQCGLVCTSTNGNYSYKFKGTKFALYGHYGQSYGRFDVEFDGVILGEVDESKKTDTYQLLFESDVYNYKEHTVRILSKNSLYSLYKLVYWPSIRAIRLNSTEFNNKGDDWKSETDGIGGVQQYKEQASSFSISLSCSKFWFYGVTNEHLIPFNFSYDNYSATFNQTNIRDSGVLFYESPEFDYTTKQLNFSISNSVIMIYCIYYEQNIPKPTPIPISIGFLDFERTGEFKCGGNHFSPDKEFNMNVNELNHTGHFNCDIDNLESQSAYQCGLRCYAHKGSANFSYKFKGVKFEVYGTKDNGLYEFYVELDGKIIATPNEHVTTRVDYTSLYQSDLLEYKEHHVRLI